MIRTLLRRLALFAGRRRAAEDLAERCDSTSSFAPPGIAARARRARGLTPGPRRFGNQLRLRERAATSGVHAMERTIKDVRYAARQLMRRPGWTLTVVVTLALGIGANTSIFALVNGLLFRPLPVHEPDRLVWVAIMEGQSGHVRAMSYPGYTELRDRATTLSGLAAVHGTYFSVGGQRAERVVGDLVSGNYFDLLGVRAALGRTFAPEEDATPGAQPVVVVSDRLWRDRFGADPRAIGATAVINGRPFTIIGVAPRGFAGVELGEAAELWVPLAMQAQAMPSEPPLLAATGAGWLRAVGRLREQASVAQADTELRGLTCRPRRPEPPTGATRPRDAHPERDRSRQPQRPRARRRARRDRSGAGAARGLLQCRERVDGAPRRPAQGIRGAACDWRDPCAPRRPAPRRIAAARARRGRVRCDRLVRLDRSHRPARRRPGGNRRCAARRRAGPGRDDRPRDPDHARLRPGARAGCHTLRSAAVDQGRRADGNGGRRSPAASRRARRRAGHGVTVPAHHGRTLSPEPVEGDRRRSRVRAARRGSALGRPALRDTRLPVRTSCAELVAGRLRCRASRRRRSPARCR